MTRNLKALGLALVAVVAMSAMAASAAQAAPSFTASSYPATVTGTQVASAPHIFTIETGIFVECETPGFHGTQNEASSTHTTHPTYTGCKITNPITLNATITTTGCNYVFHVNATGEGGDYTGTADLVCEAGKSITIVAGTCEATVGSQSGIGPITFTNDATDVTVEPKVSNSIHYVKTKDGFLCPLDGTGTKTDGSYTGNTTVTSSSGISVSD